MVLESVSVVLRIDERLDLETRSVHRAPYVLFPDLHLG